MRTGQKQLKVMEKELSAFLDYPSKEDTRKHLEAARRYYERHLEKSGFSCIQLSPHKDSVWQISGMIPSEPRFFFETVTLEDAFDSPFMTLERIILKHAKPRN
jgi:acetylornithine deacetylase/succinyl-diaminopimelate desuccinylase-like protein